MKKIICLSVLIFILLMILTGCGTAETTTQAPSTQKTTIAATQAKPKIELPELAENIREDFIFNDEQVESFKAFLDTVKPEYELFGLYDFEGALKKYTEMETYAPDKAGIIKSGSLDKSAFLSRVKQNNAEFLSSTKNSKYSALEGDVFNKVFDAVCSGVDFLLKSENDISLLDEKLGNLKILSMAMSADGMMTYEDTILAIRASLKENASDTDELTGTVMHETIHLGQTSSDGERMKQGIAVRVGPCVEWKDLMPGPMFWEWYVEGSAEHIKMDIMGEETPAVYEPYVRLLDAMSVALLPSYEPGTIYRQSLGPDITKLFNLFGADTESEKIEIMNMMCAADVALAQPDIFNTAYKEHFGKVLADRLNYNDKQMGIACVTLSKVFYNQLCDMAAEQTTLAEMFSLITAYETEISRIARYGNNAERNRPFIEGYCAVQDAFFEQLAVSCGMTKEDVQGQYLAWYYGKNDIEVPNIDAEKQLWLKDQMEKISGYTAGKKAVCEFAK